MKILKKEFYSRDARIVAKDLLGKYLVRNYDGNILIGKIVETEAYIGKIDKACHAYNNKRTPKVMPLYGEPGIAYIYSIYGMYKCFNVITGEYDDPQGVLIRAVEPINGVEIISQNRFNKAYEKLNKKEIINLTSGPAKLCIAFKLEKELNNIDLFHEELYLSEGISEKIEIIETTRIGIDYAEEAKEFNWRYYIKDNEYISKK